MTVLQKTRCPHCGGDLDPISNYFNQVLEGIGHRGSSFTDVDAATHDDHTDRWLFQEFKGPTEALNKGQRKHLVKLSRKDYLTVWCVRKRADGLLDWCDVATRRGEVISVAEYQSRFRRWWERKPICHSVVADVPPVRHEKMDFSNLVNEINWGGAKK